MSNATRPTFKDNKGLTWTASTFTFQEEDDQMYCRILAVSEIRHKTIAMEYFEIYPDGRFIQQFEWRSIKSTPIKSAFYNAVMAMFNLGDSDE